MTLIVGIFCSDGVVMASDSAATYAAGAALTIGQQQVTKVRCICDAMMFSSTGAIGVSQLIATRLEEMWTARQFSNVQSGSAAMQTVSTAITEIVLPLFKAAGIAAPVVGADVVSGPVICKSLVALPIRKEPCLFQFSESGAPEQATVDLPFVALGSGQSIADPFLAFLKRVLWQDRQPTVAEGRLVAAWTVKHVIETVPGFVGGDLQMATLTMPGGRPQIDLLDGAGRQEHYQAIENAEGALLQHFQQGTEEIGDLPHPPPSGGA